MHPTRNWRSIIGGVVYRGAAMLAFEGNYVYGDLIQLEAWSLTFDAAAGTATPTLLTENGPPDRGSPASTKIWTGRST